MKSQIPNPGGRRSDQSRKTISRRNVRATRRNSAAANRIPLQKEVHQDKSDLQAPRRVERTKSFTNHSEGVRPLWLTGNLICI